jgi:hypothetical protein
MNDRIPNADTGTIVALLHRLRTQRLPRALGIKAKVDAGNKLDDYDLAFLHEMAQDTGYIKPIFDRHPEYREISGRMIHLYYLISTRALANEQADGSRLSAA